MGLCFSFARFAANLGNPLAYETYAILFVLLCSFATQAFGHYADSFLQLGRVQDPLAYIKALVAIPYDQFVADLPRALGLVAKADSALPKGKRPCEEVDLRRSQALVS